VPQDSLLALRDVRVKFPVKTDWLGRPRGYAHALNGIDLQVRRGETLGIVGESGCGKSTLAQLLMGLVKPSDGEVDWVYESARERHRHVQIVFQDPQSSLDPRLPIWKIITEPLFALGDTPKGEMRTIAAKVAAQVGIRAEYLDRYPHQFSGGQRQRIAIARALAPKPRLIVADEPLSALDVSVQSQILNLLKDIQKAEQLALLFISHDLAVVNHLADRVAVLYLGRLVELAPRAALFAAPAHPYTRALLDAVPRIGRKRVRGQGAIAGEMPSPLAPPSGCVFHPRCPIAQAICATTPPPSVQPRPGQTVLCHFPLAEGAL